MNESGFDTTGAVTNGRIREEFERALLELVPEEPAPGYRRSLADAFDILWHNEEQKVNAVAQKAQDVIAELAKTLDGAAEGEETPDAEV